jgi:hypothetical protein
MQRLKCGAYWKGSLMTMTPRLWSRNRQRVLADNWALSTADTDNEYCTAVIRNWYQANEKKYETSACSHCLHALTCKKMKQLGCFLEHQPSLDRLTPIMLERYRQSFSVCGVSAWSIWLTNRWWCREAAGCQPMCKWKFIRKRSYHKSS